MNYRGIVSSMSYMKRFLLLCLLPWIGLSVSDAQSVSDDMRYKVLSGEDAFSERFTPVFGISNYNFFDNREVHSPYQRSQTLFGSLLGAEVGLQFGANTVMAGAHAIKDFGQSGISQADFAFYYYYKQGKVSGEFGAFPRERLCRELPDVFVYDSLKYYEPTLNGVLLQYVDTYGYAELYCNWLNKQGVGEREIFEIVSDGRMGYKGYYVGWNVQLMHFSVPRPAVGCQVYDKLMINPHLGMEKSDLAWFDAISMEAGLLLSLNRDRRDMLWKSPVGFLGDVKLRKGRLEFRDCIYAGNPQFSDYDSFGFQLHRGDPYYRSGLYNRSDIRIYLLDRLDVRCYVGASFHYTEGCLDNSQQIVLRIYPKL